MSNGEFEEAVKYIADNIENAVFVGIIGKDGLPVAVISKENFERSESSAEIASIFNNVNRISKVLNMGEFKDFFFNSEEFGCLLLKINKDYFLSIIMRAPVNIGRARLETKRIIPKLQRLIEQ
jgi:predicted regulator of Ras-like GTPase activity (Roadblock/LC7/MglB family)